jgi:NAD-dependent dihydropyrimidine dehydrogenase PreA subunit
VDVCPADVLEMQDDKAVVVNEDECLECESCVETSEQDAIILETD